MQGQSSNENNGGVNGGDRYRLGFDIGGTFTDFVVLNERTGKIATHKVLTSADDPSRAVLEGANELLTQNDISGDDLTLSIHGTTLITNALIERKGAKTALITTKGFGDVLEMGREMRYDIYDLRMKKPDPLVPRPLRLEVSERLDKDGNVLVALSQEDLASVADVLKQEAVEAVGVCFLHSFRNADHEEAVGAFLAKELPGVAISLSSSVAPEIREYERMNTTVSNAYVQPMFSRYIAQIAEGMNQVGTSAPILLMLSSGGITSIEIAIANPIRLVESGPAAGAIVAAFLGAAIGQRNLISFDMGGTTAKIAMIKNGKSAMTSTFEIARVHRFKKGSGLPVRVPSIELVEIGAGGGSIARKDQLGLLKVGPESAGSAPGPACYGFGGTEPTVTDANLVLGYLNPDYFLGGRMSLSREAAEQAVSSLGNQLGMTQTETADGIFRIVNEGMISATRVHVAEQGEDSRKYMLVAFGGAGPVHAHAIVKALKAPGFICPPSAGVASALGFLVAPIAFDFAKSFISRLDRADLNELRAVFDSLMIEAHRVLGSAGIAADDIELTPSLDVRHAGQGHEIVVELPQSMIGGNALDVAQIAEAFYEEYERLFGHAHRDVPLEMLTCRLRASGPAPTVGLDQSSGSSELREAHSKSARSAYFSEVKDFVSTAVFDRRDLEPGSFVIGPAIIEDPYSTAVVAPGMRAEVDNFFNLIVTFTEERGN